MEMDPDGNAAVIVMTKAPRAGSVKTRLCPPLTEEQAAEFASACIQDTLRTASQLPAGLFVAFDPADGRTDLESYAPNGTCWLVQDGKDLGVRQERAIFHAAQWCAPIVVIGTDSPTLPVEQITRALGVLQQDDADVVLGPTRDGGYCLLGVQRPLPGLLDGVAWSTSAVCARVQSNARELGLRLVTLPDWYDVDAPEDLLHLWRECRRNREIRARARTTSHWLDDLPADHPLFGPPGN